MLTILLAIAAIVVVPATAALAFRALRRLQIARDLRIDSPQGIVEERFVPIGGVEQWIGIRGEDGANPVLLVLHGGPGTPYSIFTPLLRSWEKHFTVVQWDRRGVGKTLGRNGKNGCGELTFGRMVDDAIEVVDFLRTHLGKDKVFLMGGSMGNIVALPLVKRRPDLFYAYVATDVTPDMVRSEALSYEMAVDRVRSASNSKAVVAMEKIGPDPTGWDVQAWTRTKQKWAMKTDPITPNLLRKLIVPRLLTSPNHGVRDIAHIVSGIELSATRLFEQLMAYDARRIGIAVDVPFFVFQGDTDVLTPTRLAEEYFAEVEAPAKSWILVKNASHFAAFTQPTQFLTELINRVRPLASATSPTTLQTFR
jgi:pimeloyl-ACP methyl ester carboxylesterase